MSETKQIRNLGWLNNFSGKDADNPHSAYSTYLNCRKQHKEGREVEHQSLCRRGSEHVYTCSVCNIEYRIDSSD